MHLQALGWSRLRAVYLVFAALAAAALVVGLAPTPKAQAEPGRRICKYVWMQGMGNPEGRAVSFVLDYKKDGACPTIDPRKVQIPAELGAWMPPPDTWEAQPVPKLTCEEFQQALKLPSSGDGGDPCTYMEKDQLYGVTTPKDTDTPDTKRFWGLRDASELGY